jgi:hypothetical protein
VRDNRHPETAILRDKYAKCVSSMPRISHIEA